MSESNVIQKRVLSLRFFEYSEISKEITLLENMSCVWTHSQFGGLVKNHFISVLINDETNELIYDTFIIITLHSKKKLYDKLAYK